MKKKILSFALAGTFLLSSVSSAYAKTLSEFIRDEENGMDVILSEQTVNVDTDISLKFSSSEDGYVNGPIRVTAQDATVDYRAQIALSSVVQKMNNFRTLAELFIGLQEDVNPAEKDALISEIENAYVSPEISESNMIITINYPQNFTLNDPDFVNDVDGNEMNGFTLIDVAGNELDEAASMSKINVIFEEVSRIVNEDDRTITITVKIKDGVTLNVLEDNLCDADGNAYDLLLTCLGSEISGYGTYSITGNVTGLTTIKSTVTDSLGNNRLGKVEYIFNQKADVGDDKYVDTQNSSKISGTVILQRSGGGSLGGITPVKNKVSVITDADENKTVFEFVTGSEVSLDKLDISLPSNKRIAGFYYDAAFTQPVEDLFVLDNNVTIYARIIDTDVSEVLEMDDHFAYVIGYPVEDGVEEVRPENNITREEIATIYYRLLKDSVRDSLYTDENDFTDVSKDRWSNKAISTIAKGGYINGYEDGSFKPGNDITRAEFVTICARFFDIDIEKAIKIADFNDSAEHWARPYIRFASSHGWVDGYDDATFRPDKFITRAEVMKIINNILNRQVKEEGLIEDAKMWADNPADAWYYYDVIEATNPHTFERAEGDLYEKWTAIVENKIIKDKAQYEDAN